MKMKKYEFIEHTADVGVRVYGKTLEELFINSAEALFHLITDYKPRKVHEREIFLEGHTLEDLLAYWLNELVSIFFTYRFIPKSYNIAINEKKRKIWGKLIGDYLDPMVAKIKIEVKAATYHNLKIERIKTGFKVEIIFDV